MYSGDFYGFIEKEQLSNNTDCGPAGDGDPLGDFPRPESSQIIFPLGFAAVCIRDPADLSFAGFSAAGRRLFFPHPSSGEQFFDLDSSDQTARAVVCDWFNSCRYHWYHWSGSAGVEHLRGGVRAPKQKLFPGLTLLLVSVFGLLGTSIGSTGVWFHLGPAVLFLLWIIVLRQSSGDNSSKYKE